MQSLKGVERRNRIVEILTSSEEPVPGGALALKLGVSRQVIVTDIAIIRTKFPDLTATRNGYILYGNTGNRRIFKVRHDDEDIEDELTCIVDLGGTVLDVFVEHRVYGTISVPLDISSRRDITNFMNDLKSGVSTPLKNITHGYHFHTVEAHSVKIIDEIENMLKEKGYLIEAMSSQNVWKPKSYKEI